MKRGFASVVSPTLILIRGYDSCQAVQRPAEGAETVSTTSIHAPVVWGRDQAVERIVALLSDTAGHTPESLVV